MISSTHILRVLPVLGLVALTACGERSGETREGADPAAVASIALLDLPYQTFGPEDPAAALDRETHDLLGAIRVDGTLQLTTTSDSVEVVSTGRSGAQIRLPIPAGIDPAALGSLRVRASSSTPLRIHLGWQRSSMRPFEDAREWLDLPGGFTTVAAELSLDREMLDGLPVQHLLLTFDRPFVGTLRLGEATLTVERGALRAYQPIDQRSVDALRLSKRHEVEWNLRLPESARLDFEYAVHPSRYARPGDGTGFEVEVTKDNTREVVWSAWLHPERIAAHEGWQHADVDLSAYAGQQVRLRLRSTPGPPAHAPFPATGDDSDDDALFGVPRLFGPDTGVQNVLFLLVDTLRRDAVGLTGAARETTPHLDARADEFAVFERAWSAAPWTHPSAGALHTGWLPHHHGLGWGKPGTTRIASDAPAIADAFRRAGLRTYAFSNNPIVSPEDGFLKGFEWFDAHTLDPQQLDQQLFGAQRVTQNALRWIDDHGDAPFFAYLHYFDPHASYQAPPPFTHRFVDPRFRRRSWPSGMHAGRPHELRIQLTDEPDTELPRGTGRYMRQLYDGEVAYVDHWIEVLLSHLEARGLLEKTLVVFTSDHGEEFLEHGQLKHGHTLYDELVHVPLLIRHPDGLGAGTRSRTPVSLLDLPVTLMDFAGLPPLSPDPAGRSLLPVLADPGFSFPDRVLLLENIARLTGAWSGVQRGVVDWPWKSFDRRSLDRTELYRLDEDPGETKDLSQAEPTEVERLAEAAARQVLAGADSVGTADGEVDPSRLERLKALGYVH